MKTVLYYFSGTGNSLVAARKIADGISNCEVVPIVRELEEGRFQTDAERIIFLFPLYYQSFPKIVLDFILKFEYEKGSEIICICTRGFKPTGGVISHFRKILKKKDRKLSKGFYIDMPSNDVTLFNIHSPEEQKKMLADADVKIEEIIGAINLGKTVFDREPFSFMRSLRHNVYLRNLETSWKEFYTLDTCNGCKICANVCPLENITMENRQPVWKDSCQLCEACINYCPKQSIQFGKSSLKKGRYVHPNISFREIAAQRSTEM